MRFLWETFRVHLLYYEQRCIMLFHCTEYLTFMSALSLNSVCWFLSVQEKIINIILKILCFQPKTCPCFLPDCVMMYLWIITTPSRFSNVRHLWSETFIAEVRVITGGLDTETILALWLVDRCLTNQGHFMTKYISHILFLPQKWNYCWLRHRQSARVFPCHLCGSGPGFLQST